MAQENSEKTNVLLILSVLCLTLVLCGEIFYLFFYKKTKRETPPVVIKSVPTAMPTITNLYQKLPDEEVERIYSGIQDTIDSARIPLQNGVLIDFSVKESFRSVLTNIGPVDITRVLKNGTEQKFAYIVEFSNMAETGKKEMGYLLKKDELAKVKVFKMVGQLMTPIDISELKIGDLVQVSIENNAFATEADSMMSLRIVKLL